MAAVVRRFAALIGEEVVGHYLANDTAAFGGRFDPRSFGGPAVLDEQLAGRGTVEALREAFGHDGIGSGTGTGPEPPDGDGPDAPDGPAEPECFLLRWVSDRPADYGPGGHTPGGLPEWRPHRPTPFGASAMIWWVGADGRTVPWGSYSDGAWVRNGAMGPEIHAPADVIENGRFAEFEGTVWRAFLDVESEVMVWLHPLEGGPGRRMSPEKLDAWYDRWTRFEWRDHVFMALRIEDGCAEGQLCEGSLEWARENGLDVFSPDHVYGRFPLEEVSEPSEVRLDLMDEWSARNLSATPGPGSETEFGHRLRDALTPASGQPDVDAIVAQWPGGSGPRGMLDLLLRALATGAFAGPDDRGILAFSRELGRDLGADHPIEPAHVAMTLVRALGKTGSPPPDLPVAERLRIELAICAKIGGFRGREHVGWLIWKGEGAAARAGHPVS